MSGSGNRAAWLSSDDFSFFAALIALFGLVFFAWLAWFTYHAEISAGVAWLLHAEISLVRPFTPALDDMDRVIRYADMDRVTLKEVVSALGRTGSYLRGPAVAIIMVLSLLCFTMAPASRFTRNLDLDGLIREHARTYPSLQPFVRRSLKLVPFDLQRLRPLDPPLDVKEWVTLHATAADGSLDEAAASRAFAAQLGPVWQGVEHASPLVRFLCVVFALHLDQKRSKAKALLGSFACALPATDKLPGVGPEAAYEMPTSLARSVDVYLRSGEFTQKIEAVMAGHAYTTTAVMSLLVEARKRSGVLAPAQFTCLKMVDRSLWYALHCLGFEGSGPGQNTHPNPRIEAAGARDHWSAERLSKRPLIVPSVNLAVDAVRAALLQAQGKNGTLEIS